MGDIILVDIDGTLNSYPDCFLGWVKDTLGVSYETIKLMKLYIGLEEYEKIKHDYRMSGFKRKIPVYNLSVKVIKKLRIQGFRIWFCTTRPEIKQVKDDTEYWLNKYFIYDALYFVKDKKEFFDRHKDSIKKVFDDNIVFIDYVNSNMSNACGFLIKNNLSWSKMVNDNLLKSIKKKMLKAYYDAVNWEKYY